MLQARPNFLNMKPPANYVAGLGRGASGFTTRSDIGPARAAPIGAAAAPPAGAGRGRGNGIAREDDDGGYDENQNFHDFEGNDAGIFASVEGEYDEEDCLADQVWNSIDNVMDLRRKGKKESKLKEEIEEYRASNPKIKEQFAGLKRKLHEVSAEEWENIPDTRNYSMRKKKTKFESFVPVPDTLLEKARLEKEHINALDDLTAVGEGRGTILSLKLDKLSDSVTGQTVVDPKGYLTDLKGMKINNSCSDIADVKKFRLMLSSYTSVNPKNHLGWIAFATFEDEAGNRSLARQIVKKGCEECPKNEDIWLKAVSLSLPSEAKGVVAKGVKKCLNSVKLWMEAARLERDKEKKIQVLLKGLENIPGSVRLWKAVVELADEDGARVLLKRAVECCPLDVDLWLALARLEDYDNAKKVLNQARKMLPKEPLIYITAAKLEESKGKDNTLVEKGIAALQKQGVEIDREMWMREAELAERAGFVKTCNDIIKNTVGIGVEEEDRKRTWVADAEECKNRGSIETARAIYAHACSQFCAKKSVWLKAAQLEKSHGTRESLDELLEKAAKYVPTAEVFWLMRAKEKWLAGDDVAAARAILEMAYAAVPESEEILLAAFKLEFESHEHVRARLILDKARKNGSERVWMKSAVFARETGNAEMERNLLEEGLERFPSFKLWLMLAQLEERLGRLAEARKAYQSGVNHFPNSIPLWLSLAKLEEKAGEQGKARAVLVMARNKNPKNPELWQAAVRFELCHGEKREADNLLSRALQECPTSGLLWATAVDMVPQAQRRFKIRDAWKKCGGREEELCYVVAALANLFRQTGNVEMARKYFNVAVNLAPDIGDFWAYFYKFEREKGDEDARKDVVKRCVAAEPKHGEIWQATAKAVENSHQPTEAILEKVVAALAKAGNQ